jgi:hypothetical protein
MRTYIVSVRSASGEEKPIGLVSASSELAALVRGRTKVSSLFGPSQEVVVVRRADTSSD